DAIKSTEVAKDVTKLFKRTTGIPELDDMVDKYLTKRGYLESKAVKFGNNIKDNIVDLSKATGVNTSDISKNIIDLIEKPETTNEVVEGVRKVADTLKNKFDDLLTNEQSSGIAVSKLTGDLGYFPRILEKNVAENKLKNLRVGSARIWNDKLANSLSRKTGD